MIFFLGFISYLLGQDAISLLSPPLHSQNETQVTNGSNHVSNGYPDRSNAFKNTDLQTTEHKKPVPTFKSAIILRRI
jgi:hypothetical protein